MGVIKVHTTLKKRQLPTYHKLTQFSKLPNPFRFSIILVHPSSWSTLDIKSTKEDRKQEQIHKKHDQRTNDLQ